MATLIELEAGGQVFKLDPELSPRQQEDRLIYVVPQLRKWLEDDLPALGSTWDIEQSPLEQLDALVDTFCSGATLTLGEDFKPLIYLGDGIWELKTADLRVFGWFSERDCFVGANAGMADQIKELRLYRPYCEEAMRRRDQLDLDEPKFIPGEDPRDVVSAFDLP